MTADVGPGLVLVTKVFAVVLVASRRVVAMSMRHLRILAPIVTALMFQSGCDDDGSTSSIDSGATQSAADAAVSESKPDAMMRDTSLGADGSATPVPGQTTSRDAGVSFGRDGSQDPPQTTGPSPFLAQASKAIPTNTDYAGSLIELRDGQLLMVPSAKFDSHDFPVHVLKVDGTLSPRTSLVSGQSVEGRQVVAASDGGFIAAWESYETTDGGDFGVFVQRFGSDLKPIAGTAERFGFNDSANVNEGPQLVQLTSGQALLLWNVRPGNDVNPGFKKVAYKHIVGTSSAPVELYRIVAPSQDIYHTAAALSDGGHVIARRLTEGSSEQVTAKIYNADGSQRGNEIDLGAAKNRGHFVMGVGKGRFLSYRYLEQETSLFVVDENGNQVSTSSAPGSLRLVTLPEAGFLAIDGRSEGDNVQVFGSDAVAKGASTRIDDPRDNNDQPRAYTVLKDGSVWSAWIASREGFLQKVGKIDLALVP